jgi:protein-tyrosine phosphatase
LAVVTRPRGGDWLEDEASGWQRDGIGVVVSLLERDEAAQLDLLDEPSVAEAKGMCFISFPIPDRGVPASKAAALALFASIRSALEDGRIVAVHCRQGIGRAGLVAAGVLAISGVKPADAIQVVSSARGVPVPETSDQLLWVEGLTTEQPVAAT